MTKRTSWNKGLTKEDDPRVLLYSLKLRGRNCSEATKAKLRKFRTKHMWFSECQICKNPKGFNRSQMCPRCAAKYRVQNYPNSMKGKRLSEAHKTALLSSLSRDKMTKPEIAVKRILDSMFSGTDVFRYTGNRAFWITVNRNKHRNPDFTSLSEKKTIEVFGRYWHKSEEESQITAEYSSAGWKCLVIWEDEVNGGTRDRILEFTYPGEYEEERRELNELW